MREIVGVCVAERRMMMPKSTKAICVLRAIISVSSQVFAPWVAPKESLPLLYSV